MNNAVLCRLIRCYVIEISSYYLCFQMHTFYSVVYTEYHLDRKASQERPQIN